MKRLVPGAEQVELPERDRYVANLLFGVGPVRGRHDVGLRLSGVVAPRTLDLAGQAHERLGSGRATTHVELTEAEAGRTAVAWSYAGVVAGPVALASKALLGGTSRRFVRNFFLALATHLAAETGSSGSFAMADRERPAIQRQWGRAA